MARKMAKTKAEAEEDKFLNQWMKMTRDEKAEYNKRVVDKFKREIKQDEKQLERKRSELVQLEHHVAHQKDLLSLYLRIMKKEK